MMGLTLYKKVIIGIFMLFTLIPICKAQAIWEAGIKGGTNFYLGDVNSTIFNKLDPVYGIFARINANPRFATKFQFATGSIKSLFEQQYSDLSVQEEFNFFEYGLLNSDSWTRFFSPYIFGGIGVSTFTDSNKQILTPDIPFGFGVKYKVFDKVNIGLEWSMHKLFSDRFDHINNPYQNTTSAFTNNDWYSMATLMLSVDFGNRSSYCR